MAGRLTVLMENNSSKGLLTEHGLSFFIEQDGNQILFDTGQSDLFLKNAETLGISFDTLDTVILSHGHHDHANGIPTLLDRDLKPSCYRGKGFFTPKFVKDGDVPRYNGANFTLEELQQAGWAVHEVSSSPYPLGNVDPKMWLVTDFPRLDPYEKIPRRFVQEGSEGDLIPDLFTDEIMLVIESKKGLILFVGCSHPGIVNMVEQVKSLFKQPIFALIGGTHLVHADEKRIDHVVSYLKGHEISLVGIAHCTGNDAVKRAEEQGLPLIDCGAGTVFEWE